MRITRSQGLVVVIVIAILLSVGVTGYRTLVLQDFVVVDEPLEEELAPEETGDALEGEAAPLEDLPADDASGGALSDPETAS